MNPRSLTRHIGQRQRPPVLHVTPGDLGGHFAQGLRTTRIAQTVEPKASPFQRRPAARSTSTGRASGPDAAAWFRPRDEGGTDRSSVVTENTAPRTGSPSNMPSKTLGCSKLCRRSSGAHRHSVHHRQGVGAGSRPFQKALRSSRSQPSNSMVCRLVPARRPG